MHDAVTGDPKSTNNDLDVSTVSSILDDVSPYIKEHPTQPLQSHVHVTENLRTDAMMHKFNHGIAHNFAGVSPNVDHVAQVQGDNISKREAFAQNYMHVHAPQDSTRVHNVSLDNTIKKI